MHRLKIAVYGDVGKKTLASLLNTSTYLRLRDMRTFAFDAVLGDEQIGGILMSVMAVDVAKTRTTRSDILDAAKKAAYSTCIALTKTDLVPRDYSGPHLQALTNKAYLAYRCDLEVISIDTTTADGANDLLAYIVDTLVPMPEPYKLDIARLWQRCHCLLLDWVAACFCLPIRTDLLPNVDAQLAKMTSDNDVENLLQRPSAEAWSQNLHCRVGNDSDENMPPVPVFRITESLIAKRPFSSEQTSMEYVRQHTSIPVPRVHHPHLNWLIMDYVDGDMLYECSDKQSRFTQFCIACTLRLYIKQLRSLKSVNVGALGTGQVSGILFYAFGPFESVRRFRRFCEYVSLVGWEMRMKMHQRTNKPFVPPPRLPTDWTPVFTHGDLNPSNILFDKRGTLWILGWACAGFYPPFMESLVMRHFNDDVLSDKMTRSWTGYRHFIAGVTSPDEGQFWDCFYPAAH